VTVRASQAGNGGYRPATNVDQSFIVDQTMLSVVGNNTNRVYGATNPPMTGEVDGLVNGDNITITWSSTAGPGNPLGIYPITPNFSDPNGRLANYSVGFRAGNLTVTAAPLTVVTANRTRVVGATNPPFTGTITGLKNNDNITATYACGATTNSPVGMYPILPALVDPQGKLANYSVTTSNGTLSVTVFVPPPPTLQGLTGAGTANVTITWSAVSNRTYRIQYKTNLTAPNWTDLPPDVTATGGTASYTDHPGTAGPRFYRAVLLP
jgi:MBG domain (YGX type)